MVKEAENRIIAEFDKRDVHSLFDKIETLGNEIDSNYNLDSLYIFLSNLREGKKNKLNEK